MTAPEPGKAEKAAPPRAVPAARPPGRDYVHDIEPMAAPVPGNVERQAPPPRAVPAARPPEVEKVLREVEVLDNRSGGQPAVRSLDPRVRGQETRGSRGGDDGGRGDNRGGDRGGGGGGGGRGR